MLVIDPAKFTPPLTPALVRLLCDRHLGVGADGICYGPLPSFPPNTMYFFNPDGTLSGKSGNGLRIFARYVWDQGYVDRENKDFEIGIGPERVKVQVLDETAQRLKIGMGTLSFNSADIPVAGPPREIIEESIQIENEFVRCTGVSIGNPHCVIFRDTLSVEEIKTLGPLLETHPLFPNRTNVQLVQVIDPHTIQIEIWERGAGYTLASGSSASATAGAAIKTSRCQSPVTVQLAGGTMQVEVSADWQVMLTGEVEAVFEGELVDGFGGLEIGR